MKKLIIAGCLLFMSTISSVQANTRIPVTLAKCTDGDTAHFFIGETDTTVRFLAINAPEFTSKKEPYGKEASAYVCDTLKKASSIELEYDDGSERLDKYGRTLAWVYADGKLLQKELVKQGLAEVKYLYGEYAYTEELQVLEQEAKKQQLAMWSEHKTIEQVPYYLTAVAGTVLIAAGIFLVKGKRKKKKIIRKGLQYLKKKT